MAWVHEVPAVMAMNTSGFFEASVVIWLVMVGAVGSIRSNTKLILGLVAVLGIGESGPAFEGDLLCRALEPHDAVPIGPLLLVLDLRRVGNG